MTSSLVCQWLSQDHFLGVGRFIMDPTIILGRNRSPKPEVSLICTQTKPISTVNCPNLPAFQNQSQPCTSAGIHNFGTWAASWVEAACCVACKKTLKKLNCVYIATL
ncbi:uncharacterized [Lates japonicus]